MYVLLFWKRTGPKNDTEEEVRGSEYITAKNKKNQFRKQKLNVFSGEMVNSCEKYNKERKVLLGGIFRL